MVPASVGFQCPECVREGNKAVRPARTLFGGRVSENPGWVTRALITLNVVAYLGQLVSGAELQHRFWLVGGVVFDPVLGETVGVADGETYRLLTAAFLHGGVLHLLLNMYALFLFGPQLEASLGRVRFTALYVLSALGGSALSYAFSPPNQPSLGASGAVFGLLGAYLVISRRLGRDTTPVMVLLVINLGYGFLVARIDWKAHVGGLVVGALVALVLAYAPRERRTVVQVAGLAATLLAVVALVVWRTAELT
jgi:membrane associated rhomboid family serine protease